MIFLDKVKVGGRNHADEDTLRATSVAIPTDRRLAILSHDQVARSTFMRVLSGVVVPSEGAIRRDVRASYPIGYVGGMLNELTARQNISHVARLHGANVREVVSFVEDAAKLGPVFDMKFKKITAKDRLHLCVILAYAIPFDVYCLDGHLAIGGRSYTHIYYSLFEARAATSGIIFGIDDVDIARRCCDAGAILHRGKFTQYDSLESAIAAFLSLEPDATKHGRLPALDENEED